MSPVERWSLVEYGEPSDILTPMSSSLGLTRHQVKELLLSCGSRIGDTLGFAKNPISVIGDGVRAVDMAGLLRVAPGIEIEIAPKFLGLDSTNARWREDFFFLATLSQHGRLLPTDRLKASAGERGDLHTLVARAMADMFWSNHRRPLRSYRTLQFSDFTFDGDIEPEDIIQPGADGYAQTSIIYDRSNIYNATILAAAKEILPNLRDPSVIAQIERMINTLSPQKKFNEPARARTLPSRSKRWQPLYDLSVEVLRGFGLSFMSGSARAPGYLLNTWRVWEDFLGKALQLGIGSNRVRLQTASKLGVRQRVVGKKVERTVSAMVTPDAVVYDAAGASIEFFVDAKYKGHIEDGKVRIAEADIYEALAFSKATGADTAVLVYPTLAGGAADLGQAEMFEQVIVDKINVIGVEVETRGISQVGGLLKFSKRYSTDLQKLLS